MTEPTPRLTPALLAELADHANTLGLLRLGAVDLQHPGFTHAHAALDRFLAAGKAGEMDFLARTREVRKDPAQMLPGARSLLVAAVPYTGESGPVARLAPATITPSFTSASLPSRSACTSCSPPSPP